MTSKPQYTFHKGIPIPVTPAKPLNQPKPEGEGA